MALHSQSNPPYDRFTFRGDVQIKMQARESVRSGRRGNFFITENRFIDCYAAKVGGSGVAVYSILQRCANSETRETWISADKMAEVLDITRSTVYRQLRHLEDLRLIKVMRTREKTIYVVLPVPLPRPEASTAPLFDGIDTEIADQESTWTPVAAARMSRKDESDSHESNSSVASVAQTFSSVRRVSSTSETAYKEEQDELNKTQEQDFLNKTLKQNNSQMRKNAERVINILGLPATSIPAAAAAIEFKARVGKVSMDEIVQEIWTEATRAERNKGISRETTVADYLARSLAERILDEINLPRVEHVIATVTAAVKAEAKDAKCTLVDAATIITDAAIDGRRKGMNIDIFYFQNAKWRGNGRTGKGQQQFERIKRARDEAHAIIDSEMDH
jgi:DNA-binding transcriptional regulator GbsR (MarR family)